MFRRSAHIASQHDIARRVPTSSVVTVKVVSYIHVINTTRQSMYAVRVLHVRLPRIVMTRQFLDTHSRFARSRRLRFRKVSEKMNLAPLVSL